MGGNDISAPYTLRIISRQLTYNGYQVVYPPEPPIHASPRTRAIFELETRFFHEIDSLRSRLDGAGLTKYAIERMRASDLVDSVKPDRGDIYVWYHGDPYGELVSLHPSQKTTQSPEDNLRNTLSFICRSLENGDLVIIGGGEINVGSYDDAVLSMIEQLRRDTSLSISPELLSINIQRQIKSPRPLIRVTARP